MRCRTLGRRFLAPQAIFDRHVGAAAVALGGGSTSAPSAARLAVRCQSSRATAFQPRRAAVGRVCATLGAVGASAAVVAECYDRSGPVAGLLDGLESRLSAIEASLGLAPPAAGETIVNWSATHSVETRAFHEPDSLEEVAKLVAAAHSTKSKLRVVGSCISPNGIGFRSAPPRPQP